MEPTPDFVLHFGSRGGSYAALAFFAVCFAALGGAVARELHKRGWRHRLALLAGLVLFLGPLALFYGSSANGFYEALVSPAHITLNYLAPFSHERVAWFELARVEARPAFRGRWRLHLVLVSGSELASATWHREALERAAERIRARMSSEN